MEPVHRECFTCGKSFPYPEMERFLNPDEHKIVYFCKDCLAKRGTEHDTPLESKSTAEFIERHEPTTFAEKYRSSFLKGKKDWWDKD